MTGNITYIFLMVLLVIDLLMIFFFLVFYIRFKKILELPWEEIRESIEKAYEMVKVLERIKTGDIKKFSGTTDLKEKIYELFKDGYSIKEIAKKLKVSEAEVELILSSKKMRF